jgi:predicted kinase
MRGLPSSGKSTRAYELAAETGAVVVNRDSLRKMLHDTLWSGKSELEDQVTIAEDAQVRAFLEANVSVIVDATHLNPKFLRKWAKLAGQVGAEFEVVDLDTPVDECRRRDHARMLVGGRYVGDAVIERMARQWPKRPVVAAAEPMVIDPVEFIPGLPDAVVFDVDNTLAMNTGRSPYDYTRVHEDVVDESVAWINDVIADAGGVRIFIVSGRDDTCREQTAKWLDDNGIIYHELLMRDTINDRKCGNKVADTAVKYRLFQENLRGKYNVRMVFDDRNSVVQQWRAMGLKCAQMELGAF